MASPSPPSTRSPSVSRWSYYSAPLAPLDEHHAVLYISQPIDASSPATGPEPKPDQHRFRRLRPHPSPLAQHALAHAHPRFSPPFAIRSLTPRDYFPPEDDPISPTAAMTAPDLSPVSPPGLSSSRSSAKSSSLSSHNEDENDISNFEDISLSSDTHRQRAPQRQSAPHQSPPQRPPLRPNPMMRGPRAVKSASNLRDASNGLRASVTLNNHVRSIGLQSPTAPNGQSSSTPHLAPPQHRQPRRSTSPSKRGPFTPMNGSLAPRLPRLPRSQTETDLTIPHRPRRSPSQQRKRKTLEELEAECDDNDDELPEDVFISNIPISPMKDDRSGSTSPPHAWSPQASPGADNSGGAEMARPRSWDEAMSNLSVEARDLTLKLETHAAMIRRNSASDAFNNDSTPSKPASLTRQQSSNAAVPPVQRGSYMVDPLPASKEKEKHLTRTRPSWLPPKSQKEEKKHLKEYQQMMNKFYESEKRKSADAEKASLASKRNSKDAEAALRTWRAILGDWDTEIHKKESRELWWQGVPPALRGQVWLRAIGNDLHLNVTSFKAALARAKMAEERISGTDRQHASAQARGHARNVSAAESRQDQRARRSLTALEDDIESGAFPCMEIFQKGQPRHQSLRNLLLAYAAYREDTGHVRGTAGIAALLLLQFMPAAHSGPPTTPRTSRIGDSLPGSPATNRLSQPEKPLPTVPESFRSVEQSRSSPDDKPSAAEEAATASAFTILANLLNRPLSLALCLNDPGAKSRTLSHIRKTLRMKMPRLEQHLGSLVKDQPDPDSTEMQLTWNDVATPLCKSLFTSHLGASDAARAFDVLAFEGDGVIVRGVIGCLARLEPDLYGSAEEISRILANRTTVEMDAKQRLPDIGDDWIEWLRWAGREEGNPPTRRR